jgi:DNA-binding helix-hairpin-helix protein with protein kinase domain
MSLHINAAAPMWLDSGEPVILGSPLSGTTGEGVVFGVSDRPGWVAKVFHPTLTDLDVKLDKVAAMIQSPPPGAVQPDGLVVLTWPLHTLAGERGAVGYVMPRIGTATSVELHTMSNPSDRENPGPSAPQWTKHATWGHLVNVAANLCLAVEVVHGVEAVIGDFQERNILVTDTTEVTLVDCDSMQFIDRTGRQYLCGVGRPEFTAPELAGVNLRQHPRQKPSDLFALAVHIHQLLLAGNHPFLRGEWTGSQNQPDALILARSGDWAGGPDSRLRTHPLAPPVTFLPPEIQQFFARAFTAGARDPSARPTAAEWRGALSRVRLVSCTRDVHQVPLGCAVCPWCAIDEERATRTQRQAWARSAGTTGPLVVSPPSGGPRTGSHPAASKNEPDTFLGLSHRVYLAALLSVVLIVVALAVFIVWAVLSRSTTFGSTGNPPGPALVGAAVDVQVRGVGDIAPKLRDALGLAEIRVVPLRG